MPIEDYAQLMEHPTIRTLHTSFPSIDIFHPSFAFHLINDPSATLADLIRDRVNKEQIKVNFPKTGNKKKQSVLSQ